LGKRIRSLTSKLEEQAELGKIREQLFMQTEFHGSEHSAGGI
jgi:hypothetical protein